MSAIRNPHTRRAYARAVGDFLAVVQRRRREFDHGRAAAACGSVERAADADVLGADRQAAVRRDPPPVRLVSSGPDRAAQFGASVRGSSHSAKTGSTPVLDPTEARQLLDSIDVTTSAGLRDCALIALMVFSFARVGAALAMRVEDVYVQQRRLWARLREKGGEAHAMPCHHTLETYLYAYLEGAPAVAGPQASTRCRSPGSRAMMGPFAGRARSARFVSLLWPPPVTKCTKSGGAISDAALTVRECYDARRVRIPDVPSEFGERTRQTEKIMA
ncbi:tyrosine-type recombinase/integrase [Paraburkholderia humisilvae]|uniref:Tyr recombinase domain-containing protein n=1 Tax=Paraburkholderia humisilvae TaxID=627669 RepID=A0A6J5F553_9BURK|nr:hypothetical protein LMG29542_07544 [Paraburkholderia humisilvae]